MHSDSAEVPYHCLDTLNLELPSCTEEHKLFMESSEPLKEVAQSLPFCSVVHSEVIYFQHKKGLGSMKFVVVKSLILGCKKASGSFCIDAVQRTGEKVAR